MQGWILYRRNRAELVPESYEVARILEKAESRNISMQVFKPEQIDLLVTRAGPKSILVDGHATALPDFLLPRMGSGTTYFALAVIRHLERLGVTCFNSAASIECVKDKLFALQILAAHGLPIPKTMLAKFPVNPEMIGKHLGFPLVVKTLSGSQGKGVFLAHTKQSFYDLVQLIEATNPAANIILQEFVNDSNGRDLRVFTIGGRAIACMIRKGQEGSFKANFSAGGSVEPFDLTPEIEWLATEASRILGLDIAGVDLLFDGNHYKICEVNSSPGFQGLESCCKVDIPEQLLHFCQIRLGKFLASQETI
jgi:gamma-F420-2:alpha-L-glutamate ligase